VNKVVTQEDIEKVAEGGDLYVPRGAVITPAARDRAVERKVRLVEAGAPAERAVALGSDHGGFRLKEALKPVFAELGLDVKDCRSSGRAPRRLPRHCAGCCRVGCLRCGYAWCDCRWSRHRQLHRRQQGSGGARSAVL